MEKLKINSFAEENSQSDNHSNNKSVNNTKTKTVDPEEKAHRKNLIIK